MTPKNEERRQTILDAAQEVFSRKNFEATTIKDIAAAAGVSPGLIYWYFKDKSDLFASLLSERITDGLGQVATRAGLDIPPETFLQDFGHFFITLYESPHNLALFKMVVTNTSTLPTAVRSLQGRVVAGVLGALQGYFDHQIALGRLRPCNTEMVTRTFVGSLMAFLLLRHILEDTRASAIPAAEFVVGVTEVVLRGILPGERAAAAPAPGHEEAE